MFLSFLEISIKWRFKCVNMKLLVEITQVDSCCFSLAFFRSKCTVVKLNCWVQFWTNKRECSDKLRILWTRIPIEKTIQSKINYKILFTMSMKIENEPDLSLLTDFMEKTFDTGYLRTSWLLFRDVPLPIEIFPC